jgi:hypothetical protein
MYYSYLYKYFYTKENNINKNIFISGATRSGTTWLMEMLHTPNMQIVWEATKYENLLNTTSEKFTKELGIIPYIPVDCIWDEAYEYFDKLIHGNIVQEISKDSHPLLLSNPFNKDTNLIKLCNINLLLPWLCKNFDIQPIVIIRNPFDVVLSQLNHIGYNHMWVKYNIFELNKPRYNDVFLKYDNQLSTINSKVSMLTHWWVIQHVELLKNIDNSNQWKIILYEDLLRNTSVVINELIIKHDIKKNIKNIDYVKPSSTSNLMHVQKKPKDKIMIEEIKNILNMYGIKQYNNYI